MDAVATGGKDFLESSRLKRIQLEQAFPLYHWRAGNCFCCLLHWSLKSFNRKKWQCQSSVDIIILFPFNSLVHAKVNIHCSSVYVPTQWLIMIMAFALHEERKFCVRVGPGVCDPREQVSPAALGTFQGLFQVSSIGDLKSKPATLSEKRGRKYELKHKVKMVIKKQTNQINSQSLL